MKSSCDLSARWCALFALPALLAACATPVTQRIAVDSAARSQEERIQQRLVVQDLAARREIYEAKSRILQLNPEVFELPLVAVNLSRQGLHGALEGRETAMDEQLIPS